MAKVAYDSLYRLRIEHGDRAELRMTHHGRPLVFDPVEAPPADAVVVITGPDRVRGIAEVVRAGAAPTVVASEEVLAWLRGIGPIAGDSVADGGDFPGVTITSMPYDAPAVTAARPSLRGVLRPTAALRALREKASVPGGAPRVWMLTLADGGRLVHLDVALHSGTSQAWVDTAVAAFGGAEWLLLGCAFGEGVGVERHVAAFGARRVLLAELVNGDRAALGLPTELVTPLRDRVLAAGIEAHVFATQTSYRFE